jgi:hypothetical protein
MTNAFRRKAGFLMLVVILRLPVAVRAQIRLVPSNDHRVAIFHDGYQAEWQLRLPELVDSREGAFLTFIRTPMEWRTTEPGVIGYDWEPTERYSTEAYEKTSLRRTMIQGMRIAPRMKAEGDRIELWLHLTNRSKETFHEVYSDGGCLQHRTSRFIDEKYERSFIVTASGLTPLTRTHRSKGIRAAYFFGPPGLTCRRTRPTTTSGDVATLGRRARWSSPRQRMAPGPSGFSGTTAWAYVRTPTPPTTACTPRLTSATSGLARRSRAGDILFSDTAEDVLRKAKGQRLKPHRDPPGR